MSSATFNQALGFFVRPHFAAFARKPAVIQPERLWQAFNRESKQTSAGETRLFVAIGSIALTVGAIAAAAAAHL